MHVFHDNIARLHSHAEVSHTEHVLSYLVEGSFRINHGRTLEVRPGTVTVVPAGVPHRLLGGRDVELWMVSFCSSCERLDESNLLMSPFRRVRHGLLPAVPIPKSRRRRVLRHFRELQEESKRGAPESVELSRSLLLLLLGEVRRAMPGGDAVEREGSLVSEALEFIQKRCLDGISLKDVAAAVGRTPTHVAASVKDATGHSVGEWIRSGRVSQAATRLAHTDDSIAQIGRDIGWSDQTHFIRQFRKEYGVTPAAWRRKQHAEHQTARTGKPAG